MSEIRVKKLKPLPGPLPAGEHVLWQRSPAWLAYGRRVFQLYKIALYFLIVVAWVAISAYRQVGEWQAVLQSASWALMPALAVLGLLALIAWAYARTTVFTITNKRVIIQSGLAFPTAVNLPFSKISSADMKTFADGTGDIELTIMGERLLYSMIWPNVRQLRLNRPTPVLRALDHPERVASLLGNALVDDQATASGQQRGSDESIAESRHATSP